MPGRCSVVINWDYISKAHLEAFCAAGKGAPYQSQEIALDTKFYSGPAEDVLVHHSEHVSWVEFTRFGIQHVIRYNHLVPGQYPIVLKIVGGLHAAIHAKEAKQVTIDGIVKGGTIQCLLSFVSDEDVHVRSRGVGEIHGLLNVVEILIGLTTATYDRFD